MTEPVCSDQKEMGALVNNASGWFTKGRLTDGRIEYTVAVDHLAPFRLTYKLLPSIAERGDRVVTVASETHQKLDGFQCNPDSR